MHLPRPLDGDERRDGGGVRRRWACPAPANSMKRKKPDLSYLGINDPIETVQPDYATWQAIQVGMRFKEVVDLLGPPVPNSRVTGPGVYCYGYLQFPVVPGSWWYVFLVYCHEDRVVNKTDPFGGEFSRDGRPCKPRIISPSAGAVFDYNLLQQHLVDMRWHPVSGQYPMTYELEIGTTNNSDEPFTFVLYPKALPLPYFVGAHWQCCPGCFRVRGVNRIGVGEWSDYRFFSFRSPAGTP
jgi:hypothetical protein